MKGAQGVDSSQPTSKIQKTVALIFVDGRMNRKQIISVKKNCTYLHLIEQRFLNGILLLEHSTDITILQFYFAIPNCFSMCDILFS